MSVASPDVHSHSGKPGAGALVVPVGALIAAPLLAVIYAYVSVYSPIAGWISLIFVAGFAFGLGWVLSVLGHFSKCRSAGLMHGVGFVAGLLGLYVSWGAFEYALFNRFSDDFEASLVDVLLQPAAMWQVAQAVNADGWYSISSFTPKGGVLWAFWGIEALLVVGGSTLLAGMALAGNVFCESCNAWCATAKDTVRLSMPEDDATLQDLRPDHLDPLHRLETVDASANPYVRVDAWECASCSNTAAIQAVLCATTTDENGKTETNTEDMIPIWTVSSTGLAGIKELAKRPPAKPEDAFPV